MARTQRFGFTHFGDADEGSIYDDGGKFTGRDRRLLDRILAALEVHDHSGGHRLADPNFEPALTLSPVGGVLPAGTTLHYRVSFVDQYGLETAASTEVSVETPPPVGVPGPPGVEAREGGALDGGLYWYALTVGVAGEITQLSAPQVINLTDWRSVAISAPDGLPAGADEVSVWRQGPLDAGFTRIVTLPASGGPMVDFFIDDGSIASDPCACDPENLPPDENFTNATNSVTIAIPSGAIAPATGVRRWRIYRSESSGEYPASSLVAEVVETATEGGTALVNEFVDTGETIGAGQPLETSQTLMPSAEISGGGGGGNVFLLAPAGGGTVWKLIAGLTGQLETLPTGLSTAVDLPAIALTAEDGTAWAVTIDDDGILATSEDMPGQVRIFGYGAGPDLPTSDPSVTWRLGVTDDGELTTEGDPISATEMIQLRPMVTEPPPPAVGHVLFSIGGELRVKDAAGVTTVLSGA